METGDTHTAAEALWQLGRLSYERGDAAKATEYFKRAIDSGDNDVVPRGHNGLGAALDSIGESEEAKRNYERSIESGHVEAAPRAAFNLGLLLRANSDLDGAQAAFALALESGHAKMAPLAAMRLGMIREELQDLDGAERYFERALNADAADVAASAAIQLGLIRAGRGDTPGARRAWQSAVRSQSPEQSREAEELLAVLEQAERTPVESGPDLSVQSSHGAEDYRAVQSGSGSAGLLARQVRPTQLTALDEVIALYGEEPQGDVAVLRQFEGEDVFGLGEPAGDVSEGRGSESNLLHYSMERSDKQIRVMLPIFTQPNFMRRALIENPDWQTLSILKVSGKALYDNVDQDVTIIINLGSRLEYELPRRSLEQGEISTGAAGRV